MTTQTLPPTTSPGNGPSEAERTGLPHPTPVHIICAANEAIDRINAERRKAGLAHIDGADAMRVVRLAVRIANEEFRS